MRRFMRFLNSRRLITRLILFYSLLSIGMLVVASCFFYAYFRSEMVKRATEYTMQTLDQITRTNELNLETLNQLSMLILANETVQSYLVQQDTLPPLELRELEKSVEKVCVDFMVVRPDIVAITIYTLNGRYAGSDPSFSLSTNFDRVYEEALEAQGRVKWSFMEEYNNHVMATRVMYDMDIRPRGLLVIDYNQNSINNIVQTNLSADSGTLFIIDGNDRILYSNNDAYKYTQFTQAEQIADTNSNSFTLTQLYDEQCYVMRYASKYNSWTYLYAVPKGVLSIDTTMLVGYFLAMCAVFGCIVVVIASFIARGVTQPITKLTNVFDTANLSDFALEPYSGTDEFSYLFRSCNEMMSKLRQLITDNYEQTILQHEMELKVLHLQINPHFLYNTLDSIYCMAVKSKDERIAKTVKALADMMRYNMSSGNTETDLQKELTQAENYLSIQKIRMGNALEYYIDVDESILRQHIPRMSLQPILENCITHGTRVPFDQPLIIEITGSVAKGVCAIRISDNGGGMDAQTAEMLEMRMSSARFDDVHGIALPNINQRIRHSFGSAFGLAITPLNSENGATFTLLLPFLDN